MDWIMRSASSWSCLSELSTIFDVAAPAAAAGGAPVPSLAAAGCSGGCQDIDGAEGGSIGIPPPPNPAPPPPPPPLGSWSPSGFGGGGGGGLSSFFCSFCTALSTSSLRSRGPPGTTGRTSGGGGGAGANMAPGSFTIRIRASSEALGFAAFCSGPFAMTARCTSGSSARSAMAAPASMAFAANHLSSSLDPASSGTAALLGPLFTDGSGSSVPRLASRMRATMTPLGSRQALNGPRSITAKATWIGSRRSWFAAPMSMEFAFKNVSTSWAHISLMILISSGDLMESSPSGAPYHRARGFVGRGCDMINASRVEQSI
mmetsp:Transcript_60959/g.145268  ORF Transcript_60959/g.145268 Transcript_60959/m.145268 type:complete len:317 (-) Transcript_60959:81-1031(-)